MDKDRDLLIKRLKLGAVALVVLYLAMVGYFNWEDAPTDLLFFEITMKRPLLLILTLVLGFVAGLVTSNYLRQRR